MDWATATNVLLTLLNWEGQDPLPVTLSQIRSASEELLEAMGDLQDDIKELTLDLQERDKELVDATARIKRLQGRPRGQATTGQAYHQSQYEARHATGACTGMWGNQALPCCLSPTKPTNPHRITDHNRVPVKDYANPDRNTDRAQNKGNPDNDHRHTSAQAQCSPGSTD